TMIGGKPIPKCGLRIVWRHALGVHDANIKLRDGVVVFSGFAVPLDRLGVASQHTLAALEHDAEMELRVRIPSFGQQMPEPERCCVVAALIRGNGILERTSTGGSSYSHQHNQCPQ